MLRTRQRVTKNLKIPKHIIRTQGVVILPTEEYDRLREDLEMLHSEELADEIAESRKQIQEGKSYSMKKVEQLIK